MGVQKALESAPDQPQSEPFFFYLPLVLRGTLARMSVNRNIFSFILLLGLHLGLLPPAAATQRLWIVGREMPGMGRITYLAPGMIFQSFAGMNAFIPSWAQLQMTSTALVLETLTPNALSRSQRASPPPIEPQREGTSKRFQKGSTISTGYLEMTQAACSAASCSTFSMRIVNQNLT